MIESKSNAKVKKLVQLGTKKGRRENCEYLIEGIHMVREAVKFGVPLVEIFVSNSAEKQVLSDISGVMCDITTLSDSVFEYVSKTLNTQGVLAVAKIQEESDLDLSRKFLVLDHIQDPGNMGTIIRTAAATGYDQIVLLNCVDIFNPKTVRSTSSGLFFVSFCSKKTDEIVELSKNVPLLAATAEGENVFCASNLPIGGAFGLVIGNEANGVSQELKDVSRLVALPMNPRVESLNAAVSASVLMYVLGNLK